MSTTSDFRVMSFMPFSEGASWIVRGGVAVVTGGMVGRAGSAHAAPSEAAMTVETRAMLGVTCFMARHCSRSQSAQEKC
jgi:hypothetical protein